MSDETTPATKADLARVEERLGLRISGVEGGLGAMQSDMHMVKDALRDISLSLARLRESDDQIIALIINMDKRFSGRIDDYEVRIQHLEKAAV